MRQAEKLARNHLSDSIKAGVREKFRHGLSKVNGPVSRHVAATAGSSFDLDMEDVPASSFFDEKTSVCHASSSVKSAEFLQIYTVKAAGLKKELEARAAAGAAAEAAGDKTGALAAYRDAVTLCAKLEEAQAILLVFGGVPADLPSMERIHAALLSLFGRPISSIDDVAAFLAFSLSGTKYKRVEVRPFTFEDSQMSGPVGRLLAPALESSFRQLPGWTVLADSDVVSLSGTYWPQDGMLRFVAALRTAAGGELVCVAEAALPGQFPLVSGLKLQPQDFDRALALRKVFQDNELKGDGLSVRARADRYIEGLVCTKGEEVTVSVSVKMPSYVRAIYHRADGERILLVDNYLLDSEDLDVFYGLPSALECSEPYGVAVVQVLASTEMFEPLHTNSVNGHDYIVEDIPGIAFNNHSFKKDAVSQRAETRITLTTMEK